MSAQATTAELARLRKLGAMIPKGGTAVEIGSYSGCSAIEIAEGCRTAGNGAIIHCVDAWDLLRKDDQKPTKYTQAREWFDANTAGYDCIIPHRAMSTDDSFWDGTPIDLLYIDCVHTYDGVIGDWRVWGKYCVGIVAFHDYSPRFPEVVRAVDEIGIDKIGIDDSLWWGRLKLKSV